LLPSERISDLIGYSFGFPQLIKVCLGITKVAPRDFVLIVFSVRSQPIEKSQSGFIMRGIQSDCSLQVEALEREDVARRRNSYHRRKEMSLCTRGLALNPLSQCGTNELSQKRLR